MAFFAGMPLPVQFFLTFVIVFGLINVTAWAARHIGGGRLGGALRGRQPRLVVIDYASVDGRRRLILVRRDNVEHLLMVGGTTDILVASNIARRTQVTPRALLPPPQSATANRLASSRPSTTAPRNKPVAAESLSEATARTSRGTLTVLADVLSTRPSTSPSGRMPAITRASASGATPDEPPPSPPPSAEPSPSTDQALAGNA